MSTKEPRARLPRGIGHFRDRYRIRIRPDHEGKTCSIGVYDTLLGAKAALSIASG